MHEIISLPGYGGSGAAHWQTLWEAAPSSIRRFCPTDWYRPELAHWLRALDKSVGEGREPPILIAHSLSCLLVAHWAVRARSTIRGAFLVAPPDPASRSFPAAAVSFGDFPRERLPFPAQIVASSNDPFGSIEYARELALAWGAEFVDAGALGHINAESGIGDWREGRALFDAFCARIAEAADLAGARRWQHEENSYM
jgi:predicted alpha/beta hydrolase family esterase